MILVSTIFLPLLGAAALGIASVATAKAPDQRLRNEGLKIGALIVSLVTFGLSLHFVFNGGETIQRDWLPSVGSSFHLRIDGISLWLVVLTTFLTPICILASWRNISIPDSGQRDAYPSDEYPQHERGAGGFLALLLTLETAMLGTFAAFDMVLFFIFWEMTLIPMYFIIGIWGSPGWRQTFLFGQVSERVYATLKFVLYTMAGSALMFAGILYIRMQTGTFDLTAIMEYAADTGFGESAQVWLFWAFFAAFAIKVPLFPVHTWLPDAHTQAPTAGSMLLAGVLLKMGAYGILRFCLPLFPEAAAANADLVSLIAVIGILYGALVAMVQPDMKRLVAYSSVSHLGFVVLGLFAGSEMGTKGAVLQMVNHGIATGALFMLVGMLYDRRHTRQIKEFGGIAKKMPAYAAVFLIITFASIGLPGTNGFVGEFLILAGSFMTEGREAYAIAAALGVILAAVYMLWMVQRVFFGPIKVKANESLKDLNAREMIAALPLIVAVFWIGLSPTPFLDKMDADGSISALTKPGIAKTAMVEPPPPMEQPAPPISTPSEMDEDH